ncbi:diaminopimelate decarboxylase [Stratiformator vulcanicus]|uniref:Diaminopimelate decarboxylase n=1 Tax=Stratiformator vulcanicus TaxID=2527980 RepID=A0A517QWH2_9PLAN|nr:diaminopimelate decarboxylase [Stratiformator vulcanicus]QDT35920.1 L-glutamyl-[BtrI acyl-carrier protein] decarboxylase [Stratiformator vulcanicus]
MSSIAETESAATTLQPSLSRRLIARHFGSSDDALCLGGVSVDKLASKYGTPLFIYDESVMLEALQSLRAATGDSVDIYYSMKANPTQRILKLYCSHGCGIEIASIGELEQALAAGVDPKRILFAGPGKQSHELRRAAEVGIGEIHLESLREAEELNRLAAEQNRTIRVSLRINPTESVQGGAMRMGGKPSPFGIPEEELEAAVLRIEALPHLLLDGLHLFTGTQILQAEILLKQYARAIELAGRIVELTGRALGSIDFGGGLGIPYFEHEGHLDLEVLREGFKDVASQLADHPLLYRTRMIIEPGRFLVGPAGIYLSRVIDVKISRGKEFVITDGGMHHHLAASGNLGQTIKRNYPIVLANRLGEAESQRYDVVGPLCTPLDTLGRNVALPGVQPGDLIAVLQSGAYGRSSSPMQFLSHPSPAEALVSDGTSSLIRHAGGWQDLIGEQVVDR